jgi:bifunctional UDP-N-acetylglucosamine pyrophosphorylase/glucosamine-1-phosphate N-acetyltransferase
VVGDHSFVGSNSVIVAPRTIAPGSYVAAGSAVTVDVGPGELAVARGRQRNIARWVARARAGTRTAAAAEAAAAETAATSPTDRPDAPEGTPAS